GTDPGPGPGVGLGRRTVRRLGVRLFLLPQVSLSAGLETLPGRPAVCVLPPRLLPAGVRSVHHAELGLLPDLLDALALAGRLVPLPRDPAGFPGGARGAAPGGIGPSPDPIHAAAARIADSPA